MEVLFRVVASEIDVEEITSKDDNIHFCFRPSEKDVFNVIRKNPKIKMIQLPVSYFNTLSNTTKKILSINNIEVNVGNVWGHRTDIDKYKIVEI
ncbi:MAG: DUF1699 family protein [Methanosarcinales archaeon]|nr:DUF1699 family protein [Methanosarcinales archaeon]